jgi:hypothetical protein
MDAKISRILMNNDPAKWQLTESPAQKSHETQPKLNSELHGRLKENGQFQPATLDSFQETIRKNKGP